MTNTSDTTTGISAGDLLPFQPYILRAVYDWLADNRAPIYINVNTAYPNVIVPAQFIAEDGYITLDITPKAVNRLSINNKIMEFEARFGSHIYFVVIPLYAVTEIYSPTLSYGLKLIPEVEIMIPYQPMTTPPPSSMPKITMTVSEKTETATKAKKTKKLHTKPKLTLIKKTKK